MFQVGAPELILVLIIALIVLGPKRLPEAARAVGRGMREMREALSGGERDGEYDDRDLRAAERDPERDPELEPDPEPEPDTAAKGDPER